MKVYWRKTVAFFCSIIILLGLVNCKASVCRGEELLIESPSVVLMELSSGQVLYEKDGDTPRKPASVTKIMTMLLVFDAIKEGKISLDDEITISEHAASMGGSQVYLEPLEVQTLEDLLKCMIISSANDAAVAISEAVAGSEEAFVNAMNERAKELSMNHTHFVNVCGLEAEGHEMSAMDIAILSRELILKHPEVFDYSSIWMDSITHKTKKGESEFGLANTNKFLKKYNGANGLKTGYTSVAGFSMSATAKRDGMTLIAVVMGSKTKEIRYQDAEKLLNYGFANCKLYEDKKVLDGNNLIEIKDGEKDQLKIYTKNDFSYALIGDSDQSKITKKKVITKSKAPIAKNEVIGKMEYYKGTEKLGEVNLYAFENIKKINYFGVYTKLMKYYMNH
ncbi:MAG: D-alanyl-D-alanine carboxypeptidase family protein [Lachnospiraceae bacterium]